MDNDYRVVRITNISDFDFTGELGARYGGRDFVIPAGKSLLMPYTVGSHIAKHLARQILLKKAPGRGVGEVDGKGTDLPLWNDQSLGVLVSQIMTDVYEEEKPAALSEGDRMAKKVADLNKTTKEIEREENGGNVSAAGIEMSGGVDADGSRAPSDSGSEIVYKDKAEVIAELDKRGVKFNARSSKATLEELLK